MRDDLLNPIPGDNPGGENLWYDPVYDKIKEARREEDDAPQGEWQYDRKVADWKSVVKMAGDAIATARRTCNWPPGLPRRCCTWRATADSAMASG